MSDDREPIRVLHVDDDPDFLALTAEFLARHGNRFEVETATSVDAGLEVLSTTAIDCVVSDYDMPDRDGLDFLVAVREEYPALPFILFTGKGSEEVAGEALSAGATDYLQKEPGTDQYELLANRVRNAVAQSRATRRAAELDRIRTLASDVNQALVRAESRSALESRVCEIISDSEPYRFAWIGSVDPETDRVEPRARAGSEAGYLDEITVTADDSPTGQGPVGVAIRDGEIAIAQNLQADPSFEPWRAEAAERGFRAAAAVPLSYAGTRYGVLVVYADRPHAFDDDERELLAELGGDIGHVLGSFDLQDRLREERDRRRELFDNAPGPVVAGEIRERGSEHVITDVNDAFEEVFGHSADEVVGRDIAEVVVPEGDIEGHRSIRERAERGETVVEEVERVTAEGTRQFLLHVIPFGSDDRDPEGWYGWLTDITERKRHAEAFEDLHSTARAFMRAETGEEVADIAVTAAQDILDMPVNAVHLHDEATDELLPVAWTDPGGTIEDGPPTYAPGDGPAWEVFESGEPRVADDVSSAGGRSTPETPVRNEMLLPLDDHGVLSIGSDQEAAFHGTDVALGQTVASHATTALNRIERTRELREERAFINQALDALDDLFYVIDLDGTLRRWNEQFPALTGYSEERIAHAPVLDLVADDDVEPLKDAFREALETGHTAVEADLVTADGDHIPHEFIGSQLRDTSGKTIGVVGVGRDITDRRRRERKVTALHDVAVDLETCDTVERICERTIAASQEILDFDMSAIDIEEDGYLTKVAISEDIPLDNVTSMSVEEGIAGKTFRTGEPTLIDDLQDHPEAKPQGPYESAISIPIGDHGVFQAVAEEPRSFTGDDLEQAELLLSHTESALGRLDRERELQRRNERLDEFASIVSHDLRNPINVAEGRIDLAAEEVDSEHLPAARKALERMESLIDDLLALAREGQAVHDPERVHLETTISECWRTVETADATLDLDTDRAILADPNRLQQLLENLFRNAVEHGGDGVTVRVGDLEDGFYVADDGPGIPAAERDEVFETGYTTSRGGTGFGLSIVREIAEAHGWDVAVTESEHGGARFEITGAEAA